jgi:hypothetical protein
MIGGLAREVNALERVVGEEWVISKAAKLRPGSSSRYKQR